MNTICRKYGFGVVELVIVIVVVVVLAAVLLPILSQSRGNDRNHRYTQCMSNIKQLNVALQIYVQENKGEYPNEKWLLTKSNEGIDFISNKVLICPYRNITTTEGDDSPISYGYNGLLIKADGSGMNETDIIDTYKIIAFADVDGGKTIANPGIINGSACHNNNLVKLLPHDSMNNGGISCGFVDGHAKFFLDSPNPQNTNNLINQGLIQAQGLGYLTYYASGITASADVSAPVAPITLGGDYSSMPILAAAAELVNIRADKESENRVNVRQFTGEYVGMDDDDVIRGIGSNNPGPGAIAIAHDAVVIITAKSSKLPDNLTTDQMKSYWGDKQDAHTFTYDKKSGTRTFYYDKIGLPAKQKDATATIVKNDYEMVQQVAHDPDGIGYCSAAFADPNLVQIVAVNGIGFPNANVKAQPDDKYLWPANAPTGAYPYMRTLYAQPTETPNEGAADFLAKLPVLLKAVQSGPLFKLSYFR